MKIIANILILAACLSYQSAQSQNYFLVESGIGTYQMGDMKKFQSDYINASGVSLKPVVVFPAFVNCGFTFGVKKGGTTFGWTANYNATGGRADYEDYSGVARLDQQLRSYTLRIFVLNQINKSEKWPLFFSFGGGLVRTYMDIDELLTIGTQTQSQQLSLLSNNFGLQAGLSLRRDIAENLFIQMSCGYEFQFTGHLRLKNNSNAYLTDANGDKVGADWSGLRAGIGVGIYPWKKTASSK